MLGLAQFTRALPRLGTTIRRLEDRRALEADILESEIISDVLNTFPLFNIKIITAHI